MKIYSFNKTFPDKIFRGITLMESDRSQIKFRNNCNGNSKMKQKKKQFSEMSDLNIVRKSLYRDMVRNYGLSLSRASLIVDTVFNVYELLTNASTVKMSLMANLMSKINRYVNKLKIDARLQEPFNDV